MKLFELKEVFWDVTSIGWSGLKGTLSRHAHALTFLKCFKDV